MEGTMQFIKNEKSVWGMDIVKAVRICFVYYHLLL